MPRIKVFKTDLEYIYVTRDSYSNYMNIWDPNIGIKKFRGCCYFVSAKCLKSNMNYTEGRLDYCVGTDSLGLTEAIPAGSAWLVHVSSGVWERVDQDMALLNSAGKVVG